MDLDEETRERMQEDRAAAAERILSSAHRLRAVIAGPGTGKSFVFKAALERSGGKGLALTFIRKLARDLEEALGPRAETYTFHKYAKMLVYRLGVPGLTADFSLYPALATLTNVDLGLLARRDGLPDRLVEQLMQTLDEDSRLPGQVLQLGTYYDAASFVDVVYRVFQFLQNNPERTPEYPLVVVDEYQDFTRLETAFITQLNFTSPLLVAGDDDQALYHFRYATEEHIRALAASPAAEPHRLPFCSRCTVPVVDAVNAVVKRAVQEGHLSGRLDKPYRCYLPDKLAASERHPRLLDARCTQLQIMARYVESEVAKIRDDDIRASRAGGHPTVLVVGPTHFVEPVFKRLKQRYPAAEFPHSDQLAVQAVDAYRRLARDERSNLGWRVLIHLDPFTGWEATVRESLGEGTPLIDGIPAEYRKRHVQLARLVGFLLAGQEISDDERTRVAAALGVEAPMVSQLLSLPDDPDEPTAAPLDIEATRGGAQDRDMGLEPTILCTSLPGAKGLSAEHVFVVGLMGGHFPRDNANPTDIEICEFLVALSRTRTACHLVSCRQFGAPPPGRPPPQLPVSVFVEWVAELCDTSTIRAADLR